MEEKCLKCITHEPETCFKTDDGHYIHDGEVFYRVLPDYSVEKCEYHNGMRVFDKEHVLARFKYHRDAMYWVETNKPKEFFIDDAGHKVYAGEQYFSINEYYTICSSRFLSGNCFYSKTKARFKNKSDAEAWVKKNKPFEPFELSIPIKTKEDLLYLYHLTNKSVNWFVEKRDEIGRNSDVEFPLDNINSWGIWRKFSEKAKELGLK